LPEVRGVLIRQVYRQPKHTSVTQEHGPGLHMVTCGHGTTACRVATHFLLASGGESSKISRDLGTQFILSALVLLCVPKVRAERSFTRRNRGMKKLLTLLFSVAIALSLTTATFAQDAGSADKKDTKKADTKDKKAKKEKKDKKDDKMKDDKMKDDKK
jgi:hypothetical protein